MSISDFLIQLDNIRFADLAATSADLLIIEASLNSRSNPVPTLSTADLESLAAAGKTVVGYVNVSVTDHNRTYWRDAWVEFDNANDGDIGEVTATAPAWLQNNFGTIGFPGGQGVIVDYQNANWQRLVIDQAKAVVEAGYGGVFLDDVLQYYTAGHADPGPFDPALALAMIELVIDVAAAIRLIKPDAFVVVNSGINILGDAGLAPESALAVQYRAAIQAVLLENQFAAESDPLQQDALSDAVTLFPDATILSIELLDDALEVGSYLAHSARTGYLAGIATSAIYSEFGEPPVIGTARRDRLATGNDGGVAGGLAGNDRLDGGLGRDLMFGHSGDDRLVGRGAGDVLSGGNRRDVLNGGRGEDSLTGGSGVDSFVFDARSGQDEITDFVSGKDLIVIRGGVSSFAELSVVQSGSATIVSFGSTEVALLDTSPSMINEEDFVFV